jgi:ribosomal protein RSM22 (predicted rRNA methylase)
LYGGSGNFNEMRVPEDLTKAISAKASHPGHSRAAKELSDTYRARDFAAPALKNAEQRLAYLLVRMPATYAACYRALEETTQSIEGFAPESFLDLGAGPGTASWAAATLFPSLRSLSLLERDASMIEIGRELMKDASSNALRQANWEQADLSREFQAESADLVMLSYVLGELPAATATRLVERAWELTKQVLVILEPGTKIGFAQIERIRAKMISAGVEIAAPCPHHEKCPMAASGDWCHFSERLERSAEHRRMKSGELGYEDEKFSFVAFTKVSASRPATRIVRHPLYRPKQVQLTLCTSQGLKQTVITKSQGDRYRAAKKSEWGDGFE